MFSFHFFFIYFVYEERSCCDLVCICLLNNFFFVLLFYKRKKENWVGWKCKETFFMISEERILIYRGNICATNYCLFFPFYFLSISTLVLSKENLDPTNFEYSIHSFWPHSYFIYIIVLYGLLGKYTYVTRVWEW